MQPMRAGMLRRRLTIQRHSGSTTALGFEIDTWTDVLTTWGQVVPRQTMGTMAATGETIIGRNFYAITVRYPPSISILNGMRILDGSNQFLIQSVVDVNERHRTMTLYCSQIPALAAE